MDTFIENTKTELESVTKQHKTLSERLDEANKIIKKFSFERKTLELELKRLEGVSQAHQLTLDRLKPSAEVAPSEVKAAE